MIKKNTRLLMAAISMIVAGSLVTTDALAHKRHKRHKHRRHHHHSRSYSSSSSYSTSSADSSRVDALEAQVRAMQDEIGGLRASAGGAGSADTAKVQELDAWMQETKANGGTQSKDNMVFFRGGYSHYNSDRGGTLDPTSVPGVGASNSGVVVGAIGDRDAWYFGAGFDFSLSDDLFGMWNGTEVLAELMFDYRHLGENKPNGLSPQATATLAALGINLPAANTESATVNQLSLAASPKIKFMKGSAFRPWIIPVGFELNIISPPSDAITVLAPGMQFGLGADYKLWNNIYIGADARYHYTPGDVDGVNTDGVTAGGYLGIGF
jgi:opacity protein-like surface antigen